MRGDIDSFDISLPSCGNCKVLMLSGAHLQILGCLKLRRLCDRFGMMDGLQSVRCEMLPIEWQAACLGVRRTHSSSCSPALPAASMHRHLCIRVQGVDGLQALARWPSAPAHPSCSFVVYRLVSRACWGYQRIIGLPVPVPLSGCSAPNDLIHGLTAEPDIDKHEQQREISIEKRVGVRNMRGKSKKRRPNSSLCH